MAGSSYLEQHILDQIFGATAWTAPATLYVALSTGLATAAVSEPVGNGYARVASTNNTTNWPASSGSGPATKSNGTAITFASPTGAWGTIQSYAIYDAVTAGNLLVQANLSATISPVSGSAAPSFAVGALQVTLN